MKVLLLRPFFENDLNFIKSKIDTGIELIIPASFDEETLIKNAVDVDVFLGATPTERLLQNAPRLRFVQVPWTGVDNLDFDLLSQYEVTVCNSHSNSGIVAEHAVALMLDAAKRITYHDKLLRKGIWNRPSKEETGLLSPFSTKIAQSNVGILGYGAIGKKIAQYLIGFDCNITAYNTSGQGGDNVVRVEKMNDSDHTFSSHDFLFVSMALTPETKGLVNSEFLHKLKKTAVFINVSRGEIINEDDLFLFLKDYPGFTACLDTWYQYPSPQQPEIHPSKKNEFYTLDNIIMSPHRAGMIKGELPHLEDAIENLNRHFRGQELINIISYESRY